MTKTENPADQIASVSKNANSFCENRSELNDCWRKTQENKPYLNNEDEVTISKYQ